VSSIGDTVRRLHASLPVVDGHNDLPWALRVRAGGDLHRADPSRHLAGYHTDGPRLHAGGVGAQFWSVFVPAWEEEPFAAVLDQIELVAAIVRNDPSRLAAAVTAGDVASAIAGHRTASLTGAEGGHAIENDLGRLRELRARGVRYLTLTHADATDWADSATDRPRHGGLTDFGREVVRTMNEIGMIVDISHVSEATMHDALEVSERPVMASHSGVRAVADHPRNVPDAVLERIAESGGVVMVPFFPPFVVPSAARKSLGMFDEARRLRATIRDDAELDAELARRRAALGLDRGTVDDVVAHIEHIATVAGVDHVGLGSDFDGIDLTIVGLEDVSCYPAITAALLDRGWSPEDVGKVLGGNARRVLAANDGDRRRATAAGSRCR